MATKKVKVSKPKEKDEVDSGHIVAVSSMPDKELEQFKKKNGISLKNSEVKLICEKLGRNPTLTELWIFNIEWSEHSSYKSSRKHLRMLPTEGPTVIQGPQEDAGIVHFTKYKGDEYGIVFAHESHNHPSQVVPFEGAATGIGGIVRDVLCMGGKVFALADPLRFGDPNGKNGARTRYIANAVVGGIGGYANPLGIPNIAGDVYFNDSFDDNCLVNVVCLGLIKKQDIVHSRAPPHSQGYDVILAGKGTDNSGFGGAAFASLILDEKDEDMNKGAVQVPDPFLKNILLRAIAKVLEAARKMNIEIGFKDCGAGGIMCVTTELGSDADVGIEVDVDKIHSTMPTLPPYIILCGETQERFGFIVPKSFTPTVLKIFNEDFELPKISEGARASVIGFVREDKQYVVRHRGKVVCNLPIKEVTKGILYDRQSKEQKKVFAEPKLDHPVSFNEVLLDVLKHPNVCSRRELFQKYDLNVLGNSIIEPGDADAGVMAPLKGSHAAVAVSVDANPKYSRISPYWGGASAVAEAMRNVAAVGATPYGMTDCLNFGNPEKEEPFWEFTESLRGISDAARKICLKDSRDAVPFVSGNVSFYNFSASGKSVDPSPIIACLGVMQDYSKAITMKIKAPGNRLCIVGPRKDELGGSVYYDLFNELGKNVPHVDFEHEKGMIHGVIDAIEEGLLESCHDISDGGLIVSVAEMLMGGRADGRIGAELLFNDRCSPHITLFSESSGFVFEVTEKNIKRVEELFRKRDVDVIHIGKTAEESVLIVQHNDDEIVHMEIDELKMVWTTGLQEAME